MREFKLFFAGHDIIFKGEMMMNEKTIGEAFFKCQVFFLKRFKGSLRINDDGILPPLCM